MGPPPPWQVPTHGALETALPLAMLSTLTAATRIIPCRPPDALSLAEEPGRSAGI